MPPITAAPARPVFSQTFPAMGTRFTLVLPGVDEVAGTAITELARSLLVQHEQLLSRFDGAGPLREINERAAAGPVAPPAALWEVLARCRTHWRCTGGSFDITLQPLAQVWREALGRGAEPDPTVLAEARARTGFAHVELDEMRRTVRFARPGMSLDLGGFGKGWALDELRAQLVRAGVACALLSFGESSVSVIGRHPTGAAWPVGIADLIEPQRVRHTFSLMDSALSTSGHSPQNAWGGSSDYGHIIDPAAGRPIRGYRTLSVACRMAADAEVLSTALLVTPAERRPAVMAAYPGTEVVELDYPRHADDPGRFGGSRATV